MRIKVLTLVLAASVALAAGCARASEQPSQAAESAPAVRSMDPLQARSQIASSFPLEVPVPDGRIVRGQGQGEDAWDYEIVVATEPDALADWYRQAYVGRKWQVVAEEQSEASQGGAAYTITMRKGNAESEVVVTPDGAESRATVILGVGAPVLQTQ